ncbi:MAG TPA: hypothetical protein VMT18_11725 [Planctomycetota bacterium]|nr:hypothetical protein [Planctomycetota bacterium]
MALPAPLVRVRKLLGRIRRAFAVDRYDVFVRRVPADADFADPQGYRFRWGDPQDVLGCDEFHTELDGRERREGAARLGLGHRVVLGLSGDTPVFSMWVNPRCLNLPGILKRALAPGQWFIYKAYTSPEHRGRKLYQSGMRFVLAEMRRTGLQELVGFAHVKKTVSRAGLAAVEFEDAGRLVHVHWPVLEFTRVSPRLAQRFPRAVPPSGALSALARTAP